MIAEWRDITSVTSALQQIADVESVDTVSMTVAGVVSGDSFAGCPCWLHG